MFKPLCRHSSYMFQESQRSSIFFIDAERVLGSHGRSCEIDGKDEIAHTLAEWTHVFVSHDILGLIAMKLMTVSDPSMIRVLLHTAFVHVMSTDGYIAAQFHTVGWMRIVDLRVAMPFLQIASISEFSCRTIKVGGDM